MISNEIFFIFFLLRYLKDRFDFEEASSLNQAIHAKAVGPLLFKGCMAFLDPSNLKLEMVPTINTRS